MDTVCLESQTTISPFRPGDEAVEPVEDAHQSNFLSESPLEDLPSSTKLDDHSSYKDEQANCLITQEMADEENRLHQKTVSEEEKMREESERLWSKLDEEGRAQKYEKLKFLLSKSNMYTQYLLQRIEEQKEEDKKKQEKMAKRLAKLKEKQKLEEEKQKQTTDGNTDQTPSGVMEKTIDESSNSEKKQAQMDVVEKSANLSSQNGESQIDENSQSSQNSSVGSSKKLRKRKTVNKSSEQQTTNGNTNKTQSGVMDKPTNESSNLEKKQMQMEAVEKSADLSSQDGESQSSQSSSVSSSKKLRKRKTVDISSEQAKKKQKSDDGSAISTAERIESQKAVLSDDKKTSQEKTGVDFRNKMHFSPGPAEYDEENNLSELELHMKKTQRTINGETVDPKQPQIFSGGVLRKYQIEGYEWLKMLYENGINGILADEMGLGKTVQCIAMMGHLVAMGVEGPFLVVAPLSTIPNWYAECIRFTPKVPVILYHGSKDERIRLRQKIRKKYRISKDVHSHPVVITSYEVTMMDRKYIHHYDWKYLIVDEGHRIKNTHCRLISELRMYQTTHRLLLSGTPLQNNLAELWSLLNFLLPEIFDDLGSFEAWFDIQHITENATDRIVEEEQNKQILSMLHQILMPFMLRRVKTDVELFIPPKKEIIVYSHLTKSQEELYKGLVNRTIFNTLEKNTEKEVKKIEINEKGRAVRGCAKNKVNYQLMIGDSGSFEKDEKKRRWTDRDDEELENWCENIIKEETNRNKGKALVPKLATSQRNVSMKNIMMQLRKCCNHPYLLDYPFDPVTLDFLISEDLVKKCGKMLVLDKMLKELKKRGHKVLLFSQMTKMLDILQDYCHHRGFDYCRLDGSYKIEDRQEQIKRFNTDPESFIFLVSTRAGGLGINLTAADTVIIYDSDWNPQSDLQAQDRCHRIGQTKAVVVYRFVAANTYDEKIVERAASKRKLEKMVIQKGKFKSGLQNYSSTLQPVTPQELLELLKSSDHNGIVKTRDMGEKELECLLDRSDLYEKMRAQKNKTDTEKPKKRQKKVDEIKGVFKVIETDHGDELQSFNEGEDDNNNKVDQKNSETTCDNNDMSDEKDDKTVSQKTEEISS